MSNPRCAAFLGLNNVIEADINGGAAWKKSHHEEQHHGACSSIPGWSRCMPRRSIWSISCDKFGTGRIEDGRSYLNISEMILF